MTMALTQSLDLLIEEAQHEAFMSELTLSGASWGNTSKHTKTSTAMLVSIAPGDNIVCACVRVFVQHCTASYYAPPGGSSAPATTAAATRATRATTAQFRQWWEKDTALKTAVRPPAPPLRLLARARASLLSVSRHW